MKVWRLTTSAYADPTGEGAKKFGGRWNPPGLAVVYTSESPSLAAMEALVHADSDLLPDNLVLFSADIPDDLALHTIPAGNLPKNWRTTPASSTLQNLGAEWVMKGSEVGLRVPSAVTPQEWNVLLNPVHPDFHKITWTSEGPFEWDRRLQRDRKK